jgi:hypothetical protein
MTDVAEESNLRQAVSEIDCIDVVQGPTVRIRVER